MTGHAAPEATVGANVTGDNVAVGLRVVGVVGDRLGYDELP